MRHPFYVHRCPCILWYMTDAWQEGNSPATRQSYQTKLQAKAQTFDLRLQRWTPSPGQGDGYKVVSTTDSIQRIYYPITQQYTTWETPSHSCSIQPGRHLHTAEVYNLGDTFTQLQYTTWRHLHTAAVYNLGDTFTQLQYTTWRHLHTAAVYNLGDTFTQLQYTTWGTPSHSCSIQPGDTFTQLQYTTWGTPSHSCSIQPGDTFTQLQYTTWGTPSHSCSIQPGDMYQRG